MLGSKGYMGIGMQTVKGTGVAPSVFIPFLPGESIVSTPELIADTRIRALPHRLPARKGITTHGGSVSVEVDATTIGYILRSLFGAPTTTTPEGATTAKQHVFKRTRAADWKPGAPLPLVSLEMHRVAGGQSYRYVDTQITGMTLRVGSDNHTLTAELTVQALSLAQQASAITSFDDLPPLTIAGAKAKKGGADYADLDAAEYTYATNVEPRVMLGGVAGPSRFRETDDPAHSLSLTIEPSDGSELAAYLEAGTTSFELLFEGGTIEDDIKEFLKIEFAKMQWSAYPLNLRDRGKITVPATAEIYYDTTAGYDVQATLVNEVASYEGS